MPGRRDVLERGESEGGGAGIPPVGPSGKKFPLNENLEGIGLDHDFFPFFPQCQVEEKTLKNSANL